MDKSSKINSKNKNTKKYFFTNYNKNIKSRNFEEDKNSLFNNNGNINVKSYEQIYSLNKNKYGFSQNEADPSYERNITVLNDVNIQNHDENIYKKILLQNNSKKSDKRTFKIIKCEKIIANKKNNRYNNIEINKNIKENDKLFNKKKDNLNLGNNIRHKTFLSQDLIDSQLPKNYSTSFSKMNLKSENCLNNFRKTIPRVNNNMLVNQVIKTGLSDPNQKPNFYISKDMNNDIFNANNNNNKNDIVKGNRVMRKNKLNECRYREKMKKLIKNKNITSPKTINENALENNLKRDNQMDIINKVNNDKNSNPNSNNRILSKKCFVSKSSINILKKENKEPNIFIKKSDCDINKSKKNLFNDDDNNNKNKINSKNKDIIFTKKKVNLSNNKDKKKNIKNIYHKNIIKNNKSNHIKYKTMDDRKDFRKDEPKNKIIDKEVLDDSINDTEKEIFFNKLNQKQIKTIVNDYRNINIFDKYINKNSKNKIINYISLNKKEKIKKKIKKKINIKIKVKKKIIQLILQKK